MLVCDIAAIHDRESRKEDVMRIRKLEQLVIEKDALVKKTKEEMKYFKLELQNREQNFNKVFNRAPNVGVMQVAKPKEPPAPGSSAGGGKAFPSLGSSAKLSVGTPAARAGSGGRVRQGSASKR